MPRAVDLKPELLKVTHDPNNQMDTKVTLGRSAEAAGGPIIQIITRIIQTLNGTADTPISDLVAFLNDLHDKRVEQREEAIQRLMDLLTGFVDATPGEFDNWLLSLFTMDRSVPLSSLTRKSPNLLRDPGFQSQTTLANCLGQWSLDPAMLYNDDQTNSIRTEADGTLQWLELPPVEVDQGQRVNFLIKLRWSELAASGVSVRLVASLYFQGEKVGEAEVDTARPNGTPMFWSELRGHHTVSDTNVDAVGMRLEVLDTATDGTVWFSAGEMTRSPARGLLTPDMIDGVEDGFDSLGEFIQWVGMTILEALTGVPLVGWLFQDLYDEFNDLFNTANDAYANAEDALGDAFDAQQAANAAQAAADAAQAKADTAASDALTAQQAADAAQAAADAAQAVADGTVDDLSTVQNEAALAQQAADAAQQKANEAQAAADAAATAASTAQGAADTAQQAADTAQETADQKLDDTQFDAYVQGGDNLCTNQGFEDSKQHIPAGWTTYSTEQKLSGTQSLRVLSDGATDRYVDLVTNRLAGYKIRARGNRTYYVEYSVYGHALNSATDAIGNAGGVGVWGYNWLGGDEGSAVLTFKPSDVGTGAWVKRQGFVTLPDNNAITRARLQVWTSAALPGGDVFYFDEVVIEDVTEALQAQAAADAAQGTADNAVSAASTAQDAADAAASAASAAQGVADSAASTASTAQSKADAAQAAADAAQQAADAAQTTADNTVDDLSTVQNEAQLAQQAADAAQSKADAAQADADAAQSAADAAASTASTAQSAADTAQQAADDAQATADAKLDDEAFQAYVAGGNNLCTNPGFEDTRQHLPGGGYAFYSTEQTVSEQRSLKLIADGTTRYVDLVTNRLGSYQIRTRANRTYYVEFSIFGAVGNTGTGTGQRIGVGVWGYNWLNAFQDSDMVAVSQDEVGTGVWVRKQGLVTVPDDPDIVRGRLLVWMYSGVPSGDVYYLDDVVIQDVTEAVEAQNAASAAQSTADDAATTASSAASTATTAKNTADTAKTTADQASSTATSAESTANTAASTANTAKATADSAATAASTAQTTADNAATAASTAQSAADTAQQAADDAAATAAAAQTAAATAQSKADAVQAQATAAQQAADAAQAAADAAQATADNTVDDVTTVQNEAALAQQAADAAQSAATTAQQKADTAQAAADAAQSDADTANTNAASAATAASTAQTTADNAATAASNAHTAANTAQTTADNAATAASGAQSTADAAQSAADAAAATAAAAQTAANTAQSKADAADAAAAAAQSAADAAQAQADSAQALADATVDDVTTVQNEAALAQQAADAAQTKADQAQAAADNAATAATNAHTAADAAQGTADTAASAASAAQSDANAAQSAADAAATAAATAQGTADTATTDLGTLTDHVTNAFTGDGGFVGALLENAREAMDKLYADLAQNTRTIQELQAHDSGDTARGKVINIDFADYPDGPIPSSLFSIGYTGSGTSQLGILNGVAQWTTRVNDAPRTAKLIAVEPTETDFQILRGTMSSPPQDATSVGQPYFYAIARVSADGNTFVWARAWSVGSFFLYRGDIGITINGVETVWQSNIPLTWSMDMSFVVGVGNDPHSYQVFSGSKLVVSYTDTTASCPLGASNRRWGSISQIVNNPSKSKPNDSGKVSGCSVADNELPAYKGTTARYYRTSTSAVNFVGGDSLEPLPTNFFEFVSRATRDIGAGGSDLAAGRFVIKTEGNYDINARILMAKQMSALGFVVLFVNGSVAQWGNSIDATRAGMALTGHWSEYLFEGDVVDLRVIHPGFTVSGDLTGEATGSQTYFDITKVG